MTCDQVLTWLIQQSLAVALFMWPCVYGLGRNGQRRVVISSAGNRHPVIWLMMSGEI